MTHRTLIHDILQPGGLSVVFQPIFEIIDGRPELFALEALSRGPRGSNAERADVLFEYVRRKGMELEVDYACVALAIASASSVPGSPAISINVHASTLERDGRFPQYLTEICSQNGVEVSRVIVEIVEQQKFWDGYGFFGAIDDLRRLGVRIALDDIGLGYSNHRMLVEVRPDLFKIDRFFVDGCHQKPDHRAAIESIVLLAPRLGGRAIAEGIEVAQEFQSVSALGIDLVQGYLFARPAPISPRPSHHGTFLDGPSFHALNTMQQKEKQ